MPNDNTHTLKPCPFCGGSAKILKTKRHVFKVHCSNTKCTAHQMGSRTDSFESAATAWSTRTPAEPKAGDWGRLTDADPITSPSTDPRLSSAPSRAGDWEKELDQLHDALGLLKLGDHPDKVFGEYVFPLFRALSSAAIATTNQVSTSDKLVDAPRITEEMVEGVHAEVLAECNKGGRPFFDAPREIKDRLIALLRQRGANPLAEMVNSTIHAVPVDAAAILRQQGAERKWISVEGADLLDGTECWIRWIDVRGDVHFDLYDHERNHGLSFPYVHGATHYAAYERPTPPPFTPTQTD